MSVQQIVTIDGLKVPELLLSEHVRSFNEVELGFTEGIGGSGSEAVHCFQSDVREP